MKKARWSPLWLGLIAAACAREDASELAADSLRVADSVRIADSLNALSAAAPGAPTRTATSGARLGAGTENVVKVTEQVPGLLEQAKIHPLDAQHLAQTKYPQGKVESGSIERGPAGLVYRFVIQQPGVSGTEEVVLSALDGGILSTIHRDPK